MSGLRMLGPVEVIDGDRPVDLGPQQRRIVLGALAIDAGRPVDVDTIVGRVWDEAPNGALRAVYAHVARLRKALDHVHVGGAPVRLVRRPAGYVLDVERDWVDVHRFQSLVAHAGDEQVPAAVRAGLLRDALGLWRGVPLGGAASSWAARVRERLRQQRLTVIVQWGGLELGLGNTGGVIEAAQAELTEQPPAEPLAELLMRALDAAGRSTEALRVYAATRVQLVAELGAEPGPALTRLHQEILRREPNAPSPVPVPAQLPPDTHGFVGRQAELTELTDVLLTRRVPIVAVTGIGGVGKTALAVRWASPVRCRFPDGQLYVNLRGFDANTPRPPIEVLAGLLRALGAAADPMPTDLDEASARFRSAVTGRRMLLVLDNARDADQVRPLLPGGPDAAVLITSRDRMSELVAEHGIHRITLGVLGPAESGALLTAMLGERRTSREARSVADLARACGHLPLALRVAAANVLNHPAVPLADLIDALRTGDGTSPHAAVHRTFDLSYLSLDEKSRALFRHLGVVPGADVELSAAAAMLDADRGTTRALLDRLAAAHLIEEPVLGRFTLHDLLRDYARQRAEPDVALQRLLAWYAARLRAAAEHLFPQMFGPAVAPAQTGRRPAPVRSLWPMPVDHGAEFVDHAAARRWMDAESSNIVAAVRHCARYGPAGYGWWLAYALRGYFELCRDVPTWQEVTAAGMAAAVRDGAPVAIAAAEHHLAHLAYCRSRPDEAATHLERAIALAEEARWESGQVASRIALGTIRLNAGHRADGERHLRAAADMAERIGTPTSAGGSYANLATAYLHDGLPAQAGTLFRAAVSAHRRGRSDSGAAFALVGLANAGRIRGRFAVAERLLRRASNLYLRVGNRAGLVLVACSTARLHLDRGDPDRAAAAAIAAGDLARRNGDPQGEAEADVVLGHASHRAVCADRHHRRGLRLAQRHRFHPLEAEALIGLADTAVSLGRLDTAGGHVDQALAVAYRHGYGLLIADAHAVAMTLAVARGDQDAADSHASRALDRYLAAGCPRGTRLAGAVVDRTPCSGLPTTPLLGFGLVPPVAPVHPEGQPHAAQTAEGQHDARRRLGGEHQQQREPAQHQDDDRARYLGRILPHAGPLRADAMSPERCHPRFG